MRMKRGLLCIVLAFLMLTGCAGENATIQKIKQRGTLRVGVKVDVPNFGMLNEASGAIEGLEIDIARQLAKAILGSESAIAFTPAIALTRESLLNNDEIDLIIATYTITDARKQLHHFSEPYYTDEIGFLVDNNSDAKTPDDLMGKLVGVTASTTAHAALISDIESGAVACQLSEYSSYPEMMAALLYGSIDAFAADKSILHGYIDTHTRLLEVGMHPQPYGIATRLDDPGFAKYIDAQLKAMKDDGRLDEIINKWL